MPQSSVLLPPSCIRQPATSKSAAPTPAQRTAQAERNSQLQTEISNAIDEWTKSTLNTASELACRFNKKEWYFLDILFQGGVHLIHKQTKVNAYNDFKHLKTEELRDGQTFFRFKLYYLFKIISLTDGEHPTLSKLNSEEFKAEYEALDDADLEELVANHTDHVSSGALQKCHTAQARVQDVSSTIRTMQKLVSPTAILNFSPLTCLLWRWLAWICVLVLKASSVLSGTHPTTTWSRSGISPPRRLRITWKLLSLFTKVGISHMLVPSWRLLQLLGVIQSVSDSIIFSPLKPTTKHDGQIFFVHLSRKLTTWDARSERRSSEC